jgi:hypothetical protein
MDNFIDHMCATGPDEWSMAQLARIEKLGDRARDWLDAQSCGEMNAEKAERTLQEAERR